MFTYHHQLSGHEFEQTPRDCGGQRRRLWRAEEETVEGRAAVYVVTELDTN